MQAEDDKKMWRNEAEFDKTGDTKKTVDLFEFVCFVVAKWALR